MQNKPTKICLVGDCLSGGGAERVHAFLSDYFHSAGHEVHNAIIYDVVSYDFSGKLLNLGLLKEKKSNILNKLNRYKVLRRYLKEHNFDYIIDFRMRSKGWREWFISRFVYTAPTVYTVHHFKIEWYMPKQSWLTRSIYGNAYGIVTMTQRIKSNIEQTHGLRNVTNIFYPVNTNYISERLSEPFEIPAYPYIMGAGRMGKDNIKQFDKLIEAYSQSVLPEKSIRLLLLGQGVMQESLEALAAEKGLSEMILFKGFQDNPYAYMKNALYFVLSSRAEGLPMVMLESLACGTPVVAFDCPTGPSEIIEKDINGLLIEYQDIEKLTEGLNRMCQDTEFYDRCKANAVASIEKFKLSSIGRQWLEYLKIN